MCVFGGIGTIGYLVYCVSVMNIASNDLSQKGTNETVTEKAAHSTTSTVTCAYRTHIAGNWHLVTVLWSKNFMNYSLSISVESIDGSQVYTCKIDLKLWYFWAKKGYKRFVVDGNALDVHWDFRSAKFSGSPEPCSDFYVALVSDEEVVLLLGDNKKKAYKKAKSRPALVDAVMFYKKEHVFGKKSFSTKAKFDQIREHDIVVECSISGHVEAKMLISVDGVVLMYIENLQWKFRGNETIQVDKQPVQVFWDVHSWLFSPPGSNHGLFIFKHSASEESLNIKDDMEVDGSDCSSSSNYYSTLSNSDESQFCLFLYTWMVE